MRRVATWLRNIEWSTRPVDPETRAAMDRRWQELPEAVRTPAQALGRHGVGCEGTHGVRSEERRVGKECY